MNNFQPLKQRLLKFLNAEIAECEFNLEMLSKEGKKDKYIEAYLSMLKNIIKYIEKNTQTGIFIGLEYSIVDKDLFELADRANALLESREWTKYLKFFMNGRTGKYDIKPTPEGVAIWNKKRFQKIEDEETQKCTRLYHKLKVLVEDFNLERFPKEKEENPENEPKLASWETSY